MFKSLNISLNDMRLMISTEDHVRSEVYLPYVARAARAGEDRADPTD